MTKRQLIDEIVGINRSAEPGFLARFDDDDLTEYLDHLRVVETPRLSGEPGRYDRYFENCPTCRTRPTRYEAAELAAEADDEPPKADEIAPDEIEVLDDEAAEEPAGENESPAAEAGPAGEVRPAGRTRLYEPPPEAGDDTPEEEPAAAVVGAKRTRRKARPRKRSAGKDAHAESWLY
jgi:hypothetical protein